MKWPSLLKWLPWRHDRPLLCKLDAALEANAKAHEDVAREEAHLGERLDQQHRKTEQTLEEIRARAGKGGSTSPALVAIAHTLKSLETRS